MKEKLYIVGAGSVGGHIALNMEQYSQEFKLEGFFDDDPEKQETKQFGFKVWGTIDQVLSLKNVSIVIGIAFPKLKRKIIERLSENDTLHFPSLIHPKAWVSKEVSIGRGCILYPGTTINYGCNIQDFVVVNMNCSLGHHTALGSYTSFAPGVNTGGHSSFGEAVDVGIGTSTIQNIKVGNNSIIGGQSMVVNNVEAGSTVAGVPAKVIS